MSPVSAAKRSQEKLGPKTRETKRGGLNPKLEKLTPYVGGTRQMGSNLCRVRATIARALTSRQELYTHERTNRTQVRCLDKPKICMNSFAEDSNLTWHQFHDFKPFRLQSSLAKSKPACKTCTRFLLNNTCRMTSIEVLAALPRSKYASCHPEGLCKFSTKSLLILLILHVSSKLAICKLGPSRSWHA